MTVALLRAMAGTESLHWIQHDATMFADDLLLQWEYHSIAELERMISAIQHCFQILARLGLQVQHRKTQLLVAQKGRLAHKWWKAHTASTKEGRFLRIPQPGQRICTFPLSHNSPTWALSSLIRMRPLPPLSTVFRLPKPNAHDFLKCYTHALYLCKKECSSGLHVFAVRHSTAYIC